MATHVRNLALSELGDVDQVHVLRSHILLELQPGAEVRPSARQPGLHIIFLMAHHSKQVDSLP